MSNEKPHPIDIIRSRAKFQLLSYFLIYRQVSSRDLRLWTGKAKSTIFKHLKDLETLGFIQQVDFRDKEGSTLYRLAENYQKQFDSLDSNINLTKELTEEIISQVCLAQIDISNTLISYLKYKIDFLQDLLHMDRTTKRNEILQMVNSMLHPIRDEKGEVLRDNQGNPLYYSEFMNNFDWYSEEEWKIYLKKYLEFSRTLDQDPEWIAVKNKQSPKSILFFGTTFPLKRMVESQARFKE